jgi:hypothetical protein
MQSAEGRANLMARFGVGGKIGPVRAGISTRGVGVGVGPVSAGSSWRSPSRKRGVADAKPDGPDYAFMSGPRTPIQPTDLADLRALMYDTTELLRDVEGAFLSGRDRRKVIKKVGKVRNAWMRCARADRFTCVSTPMTMALLMLKASVMTLDRDRAVQAIADVASAFQEAPPSDNRRFAGDGG